MKADAIKLDEKYGPITEELDVRVELGDEGSMALLFGDEYVALWHLVKGNPRVSIVNGYADRADDIVRVLEAFQREREDRKTL